jgi:hypothetical protein
MSDKQILTKAEMAKVLQKHFRQFVTEVRYVVQPDGEVACEVHFAQQAFQLRVASRGSTAAH